MLSVSYNTSGCSKHETAVVWPKGSLYLNERAQGGCSERAESFSTQGGQGPRLSRPRLPQALGHVILCTQPWEGAGNVKEAQHGLDALASARHTSHLGPDLEVSGRRHPSSLDSHLPWSLDLGGRSIISEGQGGTSATSTNLYRGDAQSKLFPNASAVHWVMPEMLQFHIFRFWL